MEKGKLSLNYKYIKNKGGLGEAVCCPAHNAVCAVALNLVCKTSVRSEFSWVGNAGSSTAENVEASMITLILEGKTCYIIANHQKSSVSYFSERTIERPGSVQFGRAEEFIEYAFHKEKKVGVLQVMLSYKAKVGTSVLE